MKEPWRKSTIFPSTSHVGFDSASVDAAQQLYSRSVVVGSMKPVQDNFLAWARRGGREALRRPVAPGDGPAGSSQKDFQVRQLMGPAWEMPAPVRGDANVFLANILGGFRC
jgi:hypothetical protein